MYRYEHGGDIYGLLPSEGKQPFLDFSANVNPLGLPKGAEEVVLQAVTESQHYPDPFCRALAKAVAHGEGVRTDNLFFGNGASDVFFSLIQTLKPKRALILAPTFLDYERGLKSVDCDCVYHYLEEAHGFCLQADILKTLESDPGIEMVILCQPNNPTGALIEIGLLEQIVEMCDKRQCYVLIDGCFMDFVQEEQGRLFQRLVQEVNNKKSLLVLKAFTKNYAMAGFRLGYMICGDLTLIDRMRQNGPDWRVSTFAQKVGTFVIKDQDYLVKTRQLVRTERQWLEEQINALGYEVCPSEANFLLFRLTKAREASDGRDGSEAIELQKAMLKEGILIRSCANYRGLDERYYRVAVRQHADNQRLIEALAGITQHGS